MANYGKLAWQDQKLICGIYSPPIGLPRRYSPPFALSLVLFLLLSYAGRPARPLLSSLLSPVIRNGLLLEARWKFWEWHYLTRSLMVQIECPKVRNPCVQSNFGWIFLSHTYSARNGLPNIKMRKLKKIGNEIGLTGCKWPSLNAPCTETPVSHQFWGESLFIIFQFCHSRVM